MSKQTRQLHRLQRRLIRRMQDYYSQQYYNIARQIREGSLNEEHIAIYLRYAPSLPDVLQDYNNIIEQQKRKKAYKRTISEPVPATYLRDARERLRVLNAELQCLERSKAYTPASIQRKVTSEQRVRVAISNCNETIARLEDLARTLEPEKRKVGRPCKKI